MHPNRSTSQTAATECEMFLCFHGKEERCKRVNEAIKQVGKHVVEGRKGTTGAMRLRHLEENTKNIFVTRHACCEPVTIPDTTSQIHKLGVGRVGETTSAP